MRILLGNNTLSILAGSETWTVTLARHLKKLGHDVTCYSPRLGFVSDTLESEGITCVGSLPASGIRPFSIVLEPDFDARFDVIIANHHDIVTELRARFPDTMIVSTIHGVQHLMDGPRGEKVPAPEHPAIGKADVFVSVSEEIQAKLMSDYQQDSLIVRNFFDIPYFKTKRVATPGKPKAILFNTNYATKDDQETKIMAAVARHFGARLLAVGANFVAAKDIRVALEDADVVVGMGRSALEGACAERLVIVHGRWGTGGALNAGNLPKLRACNFSGRDSGGDFFTVERLIQEIEDNYNPETIAWGHEHVLREHNVELAAQQYMAFAGASRVPSEAAIPKLKFQSGKPLL